MAFDAEIRVNTKINVDEFKKLNKEADALQKKLKTLKEQYDINKALGLGANSKAQMRIDAKDALYSQQLAEKLEEISQYKGEGLNEVAQSADEAGESMKKTDSILDKFGKRVWGLAKRVFLFSLITKAFRSMLNGIREGLKNLAKYGGEYNSVMSAFKSQTETLKNSFATAFAPIITQIIPWITQLVSWLNTAMDAVAQFFAILQGKSTYTKAIKQNIDYAKSLGEVKKQLASFDDINVLNDSESGSGSVGKLFEEAEVDTEKMKWVEWLRDNLDIIKELAIGIGITLLGWKLANSFLNALNPTAVAIGLIATGAVAVIDALKGWIETGEISNEKLVQLEIGLGLIVGAISILTGSWIPLLIGAIAGVVTFVIAKWDVIKEGWQTFLDALKTWWNNFIGKLKEGWTKFAQFFVNVWDGVKKGFERIITSIRDFFFNIIDKMKQKWAEFLQPIKDNGGIDPWSASSAISGILPHFATGAIVNRPTTALIGESGREAVLPLENNTGWMDELASRIGSGNVTIRFEGELAKLGELLHPVLVAEQSRVGTSLVVQRG